MSPSEALTLSELVLRLSAAWAGVVVFLCLGAVALFSVIWMAGKAFRVWSD